MKQLAFAYSNTFLSNYSIDGEEVRSMGTKIGKTVRLFGMEFQRAVLSKKFAVAVVLTVLMEMLSSAMMLFQSGATVIETLNFMFDGAGSAFLILCLFPLLPFSLSYAEDMEENALTYYMVRTDTVSFMLNRFFVVCLSAFLCVVCSFVLFIIILRCMGEPLFWAEVNYQNAGYDQFLAVGNTAAFLCCYIADRALSAVMMSACAVWISTIFPNTLFSFTAPVCIYFLVLRVIRFSAELEKPYLQVSSWIEGIYASPAGGIATFLCKLGVTAMVCTVYGILTVILVQRRWHYE